MAKRKKSVKKKTLSDEAMMAAVMEPKANKDVLIENLLIEANTALLRIKKLEQRIDHIVLAHEKCKSLKGL